MSEVETQERRCAERHGVELPMRYRLPHEDRWCNAIAQNLSASGVLFRASREIAVGSPLTMDLRFQSIGSSRVIMRGVVVRVLHSPRSADRWFVAARLELQELRPG